MKYVQLGILAALILVAALLGLNLLKDRGAPAPEPGLETATATPPAASTLAGSEPGAPVAPAPSAAAARPETLKPEIASTPRPTPIPRTGEKAPPAKPAPAPRPVPSKTESTARPSPAPAPAQAQTVRVEPPSAMPDTHPPASAGEAAPAKPAPERYELMRPESAAPQPAHPAAPPRTVTIPAGTILTVRTIQPLSSKTNSAGDTFNGTLDQPLVFEDMVIAERGSKVEGKVVEVTESGRVKGVAQIAIALTKINTSDGQTATVNTQNFTMEAEKSTKSDAAKVGIATGIGAALGAIFGGGRGAAIGAAAGGGAGAGTVLVTRGKPAEIPSETRINFRLESPLVLTEKLNSH